jgi:hypothetical protein
MFKEEAVMEDVFMARLEWLKASMKYAKAIHSALSQHGADFDRIQLMNLPLESVAVDSEFDSEIAAPNPTFIWSPLDSQLIRLIEVSHVCGGVLPEGLFPCEANPAVK